MSDNDLILKFLVFLAQVRTSFRKTHIFAESNPILRNVNTSITPFRAESANADLGVTLSVDLFADIVNAADIEKSSLGMSLVLRCYGGLWIAEAEVGWSGHEIGWDPFDSREAQSRSIEGIMDKVHLLVEWMEARFREEVQKQELLVRKT